MDSPLSLNPFQGLVGVSTMDYAGTVTTLLSGLNPFQGLVGVSTGA